MIKISSVILGQLDLFDSDEHGVAHVRGWIFREDTPIDRVDISLGGQAWASQISLSERPDVERAFATVIDPCGHVSRSGFDVTAPLPMSVEADPKTIVAITPYTPTGLRLDPLQTHLFPCASEANELQPPADLQDRVGGSKDFVAIGGNVASLILTYIGKYKRIADAASILDWGCGCGRVITHMAKFVSPERHYGCDIDAAAIEWDKQNIVGPTFDRVEPYPPTNYSDGCFDIV